MKFLVSTITAVLALFGALPVHGDGGLRQSPLGRQQVESARQRQARHAQAMAYGDPSRSPYFRFRGPYGQSGSRHDEQDWYRDLTERG